MSDFRTHRSSYGVQNRVPTIQSSEPWHLALSATPTTPDNDTSASTTTGSGLSLARALHVVGLDAPALGVGLPGGHPSNLRLSSYSVPPGSFSEFFISCCAATFRASRGCLCLRCVAGRCCVARFGMIGRRLGGAGCCLALPFTCGYAVWCLAYAGVERSGSSSRARLCAFGRLVQRRLWGRQRNDAFLSEAVLKTISIILGNDSPWIGTGFF